MSIPVDLDKLAEALAEYAAGYLLTTDPDGRVKAVTVEPTMSEGQIRVPPSRGSARNLESNPAATLLLPPSQRHGYTLLVDGTAEASDDAITFRPATAVLHRPASHADGPGPSAEAGGCGQDCAPL